MKDIIEEPFIDLQNLPNINPNCLKLIATDSLKGADDSNHPPRILVLYGSLRSVSYSRKSAEEGARILRALGCVCGCLTPPACRCRVLMVGSNIPR